MNLVNKATRSFIAYHIVFCVFFPAFGRLSYRIHQKPWGNVEQMSYGELEYRISGE